MVLQVAAPMFSFERPHSYITAVFAHVPPRDSRIKPRFLRFPRMGPMGPIGPIGQRQADRRAAAKRQPADTPKRHSHRRRGRALCAFGRFQPHRGVQRCCVMTAMAGQASHGDGHGQAAGLRLRTGRWRAKRPREPQGQWVTRGWQPHRDRHRNRFLLLPTDRKALSPRGRRSRSRSPSR